ncbi:MAG: ISAs1 family transposase [Bacillota bacterium]
MKIFPPKYSRTDKGHGRIETCSIQVSNALNSFSTFPYLAQVLRIERTRIKIKTGEIEREVVFGVTSLSPQTANPEQLSELVRGHWSIENSLHYVRDFTFDEDRSQVRTNAGPRVMATLRNLTISLLRFNSFNNIAKGLRYISRDQNRALELIGV